MHYCGVVAMQGSLQLAMLEEVRTPEPPIRLSGDLLRAGLGRAGGRASSARSARWWWPWGRRWPRPSGERPGRDCDALLLRRGVGPQPAARGTIELAEAAARAGGLRPARRGARRPGRRGRLPRLPALRDQRRRHLLRAPGPPAAREAPPARAAAADRGARGRPRDRRGRRSLASPHRGDRRRRLRPVRAPLRGGPCLVAGGSRGGGDRAARQRAAGGVPARGRAAAGRAACSCLPSEAA